MIFRIKNFYIIISWYFFIFLISIIAFNRIHEFGLCLLALVLHEIGHIIMIFLLKERISIFYILPFGFCCRLRNQNKIKDENMIKILLAGPVASFLTAGFSFLWTKEFFITNLIIGIFNLLPIGELDGGRIYKLENKLIKNTKKI